MSEILCQCNARHHMRCDCWEKDKIENVKMLQALKTIAEEKDDWGFGCFTETRAAKIAKEALPHNDCVHDWIYASVAGGTDPWTNVSKCKLCELQVSASPSEVKSG